MIKLIFYEKEKSMLKKIQGLREIFNSFIFVKPLIRWRVSRLKLNIGYELIIRSKI